MSIPHHLVLSEIKDAARKALAENRLIAQLDCVCSYRNPDGACCAIGVGLPPDVLDHIVERGLNYRGVLTLQDKGVITMDADEVTEIHQIQEWHDRWARTGVTAYRDKFKRKIAE